MPFRAVRRPQTPCWAPGSATRRRPPIPRRPAHRTATSIDPSTAASGLRGVRPAALRTRRWLFDHRHRADPLSLFDFSLAAGSPSCQILRRFASATRSWSTRRLAVRRHQSSLGLRSYSTALVTAAKSRQVASTRLFTTRFRHTFTTFSPSTVPTDHTPRPTRVISRGMPLTLGTYPSQATSPAVLRGRDGSIRHCGGSATSIRSIVGVDGVPVSGYVRAKVLQKKTITRIGCAGHDRAGYPVSRVHLGHCRIIRGGPRGADTRRAARQALTGTASQAVITYRCAPPPGAALLPES